MSFRLNVEICAGWWESTTALDGTLLRMHDLFRLKNIFIKRIQNVARPHLHDFKMRTFRWREKSICDHPSRMN
jgi:hypothetical protein